MIANAGWDSKSSTWRFNSRLDAHPYELIDEINAIRGNLTTWRGFEFNNCVGKLRFDDIEKCEILDFISSDEVMFLEDSAFPKRSNGGGRRQPYTEHNQEAKQKCRKFAFDTWKKERTSGVDKKQMTSLNDMVRLLVEEEIAIRTDGNAYTDKQIGIWISGIKTGTKDPLFHP